MIPALLYLPDICTFYSFGGPTLSELHYFNKLNNRKSEALINICSYIISLFSLF